jgi:hypothetical protein
MDSILESIFPVRVNGDNRVGFIEISAAAFEKNLRGSLR